MGCLHGLGFAWSYKRGRWDRPNSRICRLCGLIQQGSNVETLFSFEWRWIPIGYAEDKQALIKKWRLDHRSTLKAEREQEKAERQAREERLRRNIIKSDQLLESTEGEES